MAKGLETLLLKQFAPRIAPILDNAEKEIIKYLNEIELIEGETHATVVIDNDGEKILLVVCTFAGPQFRREIARFEKNNLIKLVAKTL
ncbi:MAG: hypothetical protein K9H26_10780 [Prolixibacteraceae bacterium]|nr:hypothetical protein [Prolixibacteraceae bacterium]